MIDMAIQTWRNTSVGKFLVVSWGGARRALVGGLLGRGSGAEGSECATAYLSDASSPSGPVP